MTMVSIPQSEYRSLRKEAEAYRKLTSRFFDVLVRDGVTEVISDFKNTGLYSEGLLIDLEEGLRKSSYAKGKGRRAS